MRSYIKTKLLLIVSFISLSSFSQVKKDSLKVGDNILDEVVISSKPISEKFSVTKVEKLDVYLNPVSNGDVLKGINILPSSTNINETANPTLRGGRADRSRVYLNGVPILNPVRNTSDNGLGSFSLFNTELIHKQYVYSINPPLTYGNSSAGLVEIETNKRLSQENLHVSLALSNIGFLLNKKGKREGNFFQVYGNNHFSSALIKLNDKNIPNLEKFSIRDLGLNARFKINNNINANTFNYFIDESYASKRYLFNYNGKSNANQKRFFLVNNLEYKKGKSRIMFSSLVDISNQKYILGVIDSKTDRVSLFSSLNHKYKINNNLSFRYGFDFFSSEYNYDETRPIYFSNLNENAPSFKNIEKKSIQNLETYAYVSQKINNDFGLSLGLRKNLPVFESNKDGYLSYQLSSYFSLNKKNKFIFGLGKYNSYSTPNYINNNISLLSSFQVALDYKYTSKRNRITSAIYYKEDDGSYLNSNNMNYNSTKSLGLEFSWDYNLSKYVSFGISNTFLDQHYFLDDKKYNSVLNLKYFIRSQIIYFNPKFFTMSLTLSTRPGNNYTKIIGADFNSQTNLYTPIFEERNTSTFNNYMKVDFGMNKIFNINGNTLITYFSINNLLNRKNYSTPFYNEDYSTINFDTYQRRIVYFGIQYRFNNF